MPVPFSSCIGPVRQELPDRGYETGKDFPVLPENCIEKLRIRQTARTDPIQALGKDPAWLYLWH